MLVFSRREGEMVTIGNDVEVQLVQIRGEKAVLGFNAPKDVAIHRKEVYDAIYRDKKNTITGVGNGKQIGELLSLVRQLTAVLGGVRSINSPDYMMLAERTINETLAAIGDDRRVYYSLSATALLNKPRAAGA